MQKSVALRPWCWLLRFIRAEVEYHLPNEWRIYEAVFVRPCSDLSQYILIPWNRCQPATTEFNGVRTIKKAESIYHLQDTQCRAVSGTLVGLTRLLGALSSQVPSGLFPITPRI